MHHMLDQNTGTSYPSLSFPSLSLAGMTTSQEMMSDSGLKREKRTARKKKKETLEIKRGRERKGDERPNQLIFAYFEISDPNEVEHLPKFLDFPPSLVTLLIPLGATLAQPPRQSPHQPAHAAQSSSIVDIRCLAMAVLRSQKWGYVRIIVGTILGGILGFYVMDRVDKSYKEKMNEELKRYEAELKKREKKNQLEESL
ncbi:hypothetical protein L484_012668 [Morus notabilis]|uniref:Uncharacterized protein n=2 Tax=Morus notabilis TaxID=981085 RepID=W9QD08_9ROSA|nr:hypothetical protein L484_012668 [Morus notabilis]